MVAMWHADNDTETSTYGGRAPNVKARSAIFGSNDSCRPTDCKVTQWPDWEPCNDKAVRTRSRQVMVYTALGGRPCPFFSESQKWHSQDCLVSCWSDWGECKNGVHNTYPFYYSWCNNWWRYPQLSETKPCTNPPTTLAPTPRIQINKLVPTPEPTTLANNSSSTKSSCSNSSSSPNYLIVNNRMEALVTQVISLVNSRLGWSLQNAHSYTNQETFMHYLIRRYWMRMRNPQMILLLIQTVVNLFDSWYEFCCRNRFEFPRVPSIWILIVTHYSSIECKICGQEFVSNPQEKSWVWCWNKPSW